MTHRIAGLTTLTMNPSVERDFAFRDFDFDRKLRCLRTHTRAGGGGIVAARAMKRLGADPLAIFPSGGLYGPVLERLVADEGLRQSCFAVAGECRTAITADEIGTGRQIRFVTAGPRLSEEEWSAGLGLMTAASASGYAVAIGSLPLGAPDDFYARLAKQLRQSGGAKLVLATSGTPLRHALDAGVYLVRLSLGEFAELIGESDPDRTACRAAGEKLVTNGNAEIVAVTMGADGALLVSRDVALYAKPPPLTLRDIAGAADGFLAAMTLGLARGRGLNEALRYAIAVDAAARLPPELACRWPDPVAELTPQVHIETL